MSKANALAINYLADPAVACRYQRQVGQCLISIWSTVKEWPERDVAICENGESCYVISKDMDSLSFFIKDAKPAIDNLAFAKELMALLLPDNIKLLTDDDPESIKSDTGHREGPRFINQSLVFYCMDFSHGTVLELTIDHNFLLHWRVAGKGKAIDRL